MKMEELKGKVCGYNKKTLVVVVVLLIIAGGAFCIGAKYEKNKLSKLGLLGKSQNVDVCKAKDMVTGEITAITDNSMSIKTADGNIQSVLISAALKTGKKSASMLTSLAVGQQVTVKGLKNVDGSFSAQSVKSAVPNAPADSAAPIK
jgi:ribosomal protein S1